MKENVRIKELIFKVLRIKVKFITVQELRSIPALSGYNTKRLTALLNQLVREGKVERIVEKKWIGFKLI